MKLLVIGSGGREHALGWKLSQSSQLESIFFSPGNPGTAQLGTNVSLADHAATVAFCREQGIGLVVVGPEQPLVEGIADALALAGISCFGPKADAARLEGSKSFAKEIMLEAGVPTAAHRTFCEFEAALAYAAGQPHPLVVKADGLAAGKGVSICANLEETRAALSDSLLSAKFGAAGGTVVIEAFLQGTECSFHVISDGKRMLPLIGAQDHKTLFDAGLGPNTGGMGTFAPSPGIKPEMAESLANQLCAPVLEALAKRDCEFRGVLFAGLMLTEKGPYVLEFNCRFGDPETQVLMSLMDFDLLPVLAGAAQGQLPQIEPKWKAGAACCVVMAAAGYPESPRKGDPIQGLEGEDPETMVFQAGTRLEAGQVVSNGGRVLGVTASGETISTARERAYRRLARIHFAGAQFRSDIGLSAV